MTSLAGSIAASILGYDPFVRDRRRRAVTIGDSTAAGVATVTPSALVANGNLITATAAGHSVMTGSRVFASRADQAEFNGLSVVVASDAGSFTYVAPGNLPRVANATTASSFQIRMVDTWNGINPLAIASALGGWLFDDIVNLAVGGETAQQTADRFGVALSMRPALIEIATGMNSINDGLPAATVFAPIRSMIDKAIAQGTPVLVRTVGPLGPSNANYSTARVAEINRLNWIIRDYAVQHADYVDVAEAFGLWVDPTATDGAWRAGLTSDDLHPISRAQWLLAKSILPALQRRFSRLPWPTWSITDDVVDDAGSLNLFEFGLGAGSGGTVVAGAGNSGTISDGLSSQIRGTPVSTVNTHGIARADGIGLDNRCVITADNAGDGSTFFATSPSLHVRADDYPGRVLRCGVCFKINALAADVQNMQFSFNVTEGGVARSIEAMTSLFIPSGETPEFWFVTPPVPVPPGALTSVRPRITYTLNGAGTSEVVYGRWFMRVSPE